MKFDSEKVLYLEIEVSCVSLGARLQQVREGINCRHDEAQDNTALYSMVLPTKTYTV